MNNTNQCLDRQTYTCCCCGKNVINPPSTLFPVSGPIKGSGFVLNDTIPYLVDTTYTSYGPTICFSRDVYTNINQRNDVSCINLDAVFDMTNTCTQNNTRLEMLEKMISKKYYTLNGVLPIIKNEIKYKISYNITDPDGGIVHEGEICTDVLDTRFHFTDITDRFVTSARSVVVDILPTMPSTDVYTINFTKIEAFVNVIDTKQHIVDEVNPFYKFTNNNTEIRLMHEQINVTEPTETGLCIAECEINQSFCFDASINTRLRMTFTAFMSSLIVTGDTSNIWSVLDSPTEEIVSDLGKRVESLEETIKELSEIIINQNKIISDMNDKVVAHDKDIKLMKTQISDLTNKVILLEKIPLATLTYRDGIKFVSGQLTWTEYGELYQAVTDFESSGSLDADYRSGMLVRVKGE
jgi:uncharacterized coiled-coil protein SlyX